LVNRTFQISKNLIEVGTRIYKMGDRIVMT
jgi:hypothetical protein